MKQKITIDDVAKHCHVSKSSVSRYLNHGYVSAKNKEIIKKAIEELGFERDFFASKIKAKRTRLLGIVVNHLSVQGHDKILEGMQRKLKESDYQGIILLSNGKQAEECLKELLGMGVDSIIFLDCKEPEKLSEFVLQNKCKVLFVKYPCSYAPFLDLDENRSGMLMGEYLKEKHIHSILYLQHDKTTGKKRLEGIEAAFGEVPYDLAVHTVTDNEDAYQKMKSAASKAYQIVLCDNEGIALSVLKLCHELHIHVPQNLSVACFSGGDISCYCYPALTSIVYQYEIFGANLVEEAIAINEERPPEWEQMEYELIERDSVCEYE